MSGYGRQEGPAAGPGGMISAMPPVRLPVLAHLEATPLFQFLRPAERELLAPFCRVLVFEKGGTVFSEGDLARDLCFVVIGKVKIVKAAGGRDVILGIFGPGEPVGAVASFEGKAFPASAVAMEPSTILFVREKEFFALVDRQPEMTRRLLQGLVVRQLEMTRRLADMVGSVEYRMARMFLALAGRVGRKEGTGTAIPLALSRQEIADMAGTTVETAIRVMSRWGKEGLVATRDDGFLVPDLAALERVGSRAG